MFLLCGCGGLRGGKDELRDFHPLLPCQALGQAFDPLLSREREFGGCFVLLLPHPVDTALKPV